MRVWPNGAAVTVLRMLVLRRPTPADLERLAVDQAAASLTYESVGATVSGPAPDGYRFESFERRVGTDFERARASLAQWRPHEGAGIDHWADGAIAVGTTVALAAPLPVGFALAACRIVVVVDEPDRFGFAYGTLPIHPEAGEELFMLERRGDDVWFRIVVFSRPRQLLARAAAPIARLLQAQATRRYLDAMAQHERPTGTTGGKFAPSG